MRKVHTKEKLNPRHCFMARAQLYKCSCVVFPCLVWFLHLVSSCAGSLSCGITQTQELAIYAMQFRDDAKDWGWGKKSIIGLWPLRD